MVNLVQVDIEELIAFRADYAELKAENDELKRENDGLKLGLQTKPGERVVLGDGRKVALVYFKKSGD